MPRIKDTEIKNQTTTKDEFEVLLKKAKSFDVRKAILKELFEKP